MEFLNAQVKYITEQMRNLGASQKVAIVLLVIILLGGMWGMIQWSRQADWLPLLDQSLTAEQIDLIDAQLVSAGVQTKREGDRLYLRGDENERRRVQAYLGQNSALPKDISLSYAVLVRENNIWESDHVKTWKHTRGLETELSAVLSRFAGIKEARVLIVVPQRRGVGTTAATASASVNVKLLGGDSLDKKRVLAIANFVAGAVPGLDPKNITITDGNRSYRVPDEGDGLAGNLLELQREQEEHYARKIYDQLKHIEGVVVNVRAMLRQDDEQVRDLKYGAPTVSKTEEETEETQGPSLAAGPGVRPNQARQIADTGAGASSNRAKSSETMEGKRDETNTQIMKRAGAVENVTASISVPSTYLQRVLKVQQPDTKDTSPTAIQKVADLELPRIKKQIEPLIAELNEKNAKSDKLVVVDWYYATEGTAEETIQTASFDPLVLAKGYGPQIGLGLLVLFSLFMVLRIAKRAQVAMAPATVSPVAASAAARAAHGPLQALDTGPQPVGEAQELDGILMGHEVDEATVRSHQILKQIGQIIKDDPTSVSGLIEYMLKDEK